MVMDLQDGLGNAVALLESGWHEQRCVPEPPFHGPFVGWAPLGWARLQYAIAWGARDDLLPFCPVERMICWCVARSR